jgi:hypothetical protein
VWSCFSLVLGRLPVLFLGKRWCKPYATVSLCCGGFINLKSDTGCLLSKKRVHCGGWGRTEENGFGIEEEWLGGCAGWIEEKGLGGGAGWIEERCVPRAFCDFEANFRLIGRIRSNPANLVARRVP